MLIHRSIGIALILFGMTTANAQEYRDDVSLEQYLYALGQIMPSAREGAEAYLRAFERHCARRLTTVELRKAIADGDGDPILMSMIRAKQIKDDQAVTTLAGQVSCKSRR